MAKTSFFDLVLVWPILNLLLLFYQGFSFLRFPGALGWSIIVLTVFIRFIISPLYKTQIKSAQKLASLKPQIDKLSKKYKNDKTRLQQEQLRLYKEAGVNPASGCVVFLIQMPILIALYNVFWRILSFKEHAQLIEFVNKATYFPFLKIQSLDLSFLGMSLMSKPSAWKQDGWWLLLIPVLTGFLQWYQIKLMQPAKKPVEVVDKKKDEKKEKDFSQAMQEQMNIMTPLLIGFLAYSFPLGLSLYWNTFSVFGIIQQINLNKKNERSRSN